MSQFGRPKFVGVCRPVIASVAELLSMMFWASAAEILAVRYYGICVSKVVSRGSNRSTYCVDFDLMLSVLIFDGLEERLEPFERSKISAHPEEIHLLQS